MVNMIMVMIFTVGFGSRICPLLAENDAFNILDTQLYAVLRSQGTINEWSHACPFHPVHDRTVQLRMGNKDWRRPPFRCAHCYATVDTPQALVGF